MTTIVTESTRPRKRARYVPSGINSKRSVRSGYTYPKRMSRSMSLPRELAMIQNRINSTVVSSSGYLSINSSSGFNAVSPSVVFAFTGTAVSFSIGGSLYNTFGYAYANSQALGVCYDQYRIRKVVCAITFTSNSSGTNTTTSLPNLYGVIDYNDGDQLASQNEALSYSSCKFMQLGNSSGSSGGIQYLTLTRPTTQMLASTTVVGTSTGSIARVSPWIDTDALTVEHLGMKFWTDTPAGTNTVSGQCQFTFRVFIDYKNLA